VSTLTANFRFAYGTKLSDGQEEALNAILDKPIERDEGEEALKKPAAEREVRSYVNYEGPLEDVLTILGGKAAIEVAGIGDPRPLIDLRDQIMGRFGEFEDRMTRNAVHQDEYVNRRLDVHVPGIGLLLLDEVQLLEDGCTDMLNDRLSKGWRIIAACPQPDQRRPDYILGRVAPAT
jgi:hypothetical protein